VFRGWRVKEREGRGKEGRGRGEGTIISALLVLLIPNTTANHAITYYMNSTCDGVLSLIINYVGTRE